MRQGGGLKVPRDQCLFLMVGGVRPPHAGTQCPVARSLGQPLLQLPTRMRMKRQRFWLCAQGKQTLAFEKEHGQCVPPTGPAPSQHFRR